MVSQFTVYGAPGTGSVIVEAALTLAGQTYEREDQPSRAKGGPRAEVNPLRQVPSLKLPTGEIMTESAAILIWLAETYALGPAPGDSNRPAFLRWMSFVSGQIYSLFWIRDDYTRVAASAEHETLLAERTAERIATCWSVMDAGVTPGRYIFGDEISVLDLYVAVISRWGPRRRRFYEVAPKLAQVVRRVDAEPRLQALWGERYPFAEGWEG